MDDKYLGKDLIIAGENRELFFSVPSGYTPLEVRRALQDLPGYLSTHCLKFWVNSTHTMGQKFYLLTKPATKKEQWQTIYMGNKPPVKLFGDAALKKLEKR